MVAPAQAAKRKAALALVAQIHLERVSRKAVMRAQIEEQLRDLIADVELRESRAANDALALGASKTAIGRALGTANWDSINATLARTAGHQSAEDLFIDPLSDTYHYSRTTGVLTVTLNDVSIDFTIATRADGSRYTVAVQPVDFTAAPVHWMNIQSNENEALAFIDRITAA